MVERINLLKKNPLNTKGMVVFIAAKKNQRAAAMKTRKYASATIKNII
jgi:hypothetical protein